VFVHFIFKNLLTILFFIYIKNNKIPTIFKFRFISTLIFFFFFIYNNFKKKKKKKKNKNKII